MPIVRQAADREIHDFGRPGNRQQMQVRDLMAARDQRRLELAIYDFFSCPAVVRLLTHPKYLHARHRTPSMLTTAAVADRPASTCRFSCGLLLGRRMAALVPG